MTDHALYVVTEGAKLGLTCAPEEVVRLWAVDLEAFHVCPKTAVVPCCRDTGLPCVFEAGIHDPLAAAVIRHALAMHYGEPLAAEQALAEVHALMADAVLA